MNTSIRNKSKGKNHLVDVSAIRKRIADKGMTLTSFGREIGIDDRQIISARLRNVSPITADEIFSMADSLGCTVDDLRIS